VTRLPWLSFNTIVARILLSFAEVWTLPLWKEKQANQLSMGHLILENSTYLTSAVETTSFNFVFLETLAVMVCS
jgi:hypothetical protein